MRRLVSTTLAIGALLTGCSIESEPTSETIARREAAMTVQQTEERVNESRSFHVDDHPYRVRLSHADRGRSTITADHLYNCTFTGTSQFRRDETPSTSTYRVEFVGAYIKGMWVPVPAGQDRADILSQCRSDFQTAYEDWRAEVDAKITQDTRELDDVIEIVRQH